MIRWETIKEGYSGFEKLAAEYVASEFQFPFGEWKKTKETRDGNKDAYTVIIGYHPHADQDDTWWMEAKYSISENVKYLTRFRLDATIVSSIFHKKVSKIIFVTNIDVHSKTISDIRVALQKTIGCGEVYFCTKQVLEYWLIKNHLQYKEFFPDSLPLNLEERPLFVSEDISIYPYPSDNRYIEKCIYIYFDKTYQAFFKVICAEAQAISLAPAQKGVLIEGDSTLQLSQGENAVHILFRVTRQYQPKLVEEDGRNYQRLDLFIINNRCPVLILTPVEILQSTDFQLAIQSQQEISSQLISLISESHKESGMHIVMIHGESGTGKSYVVHQTTKSKILCSDYTYYYNFTADQTENAKRILDLVFFLLLPYVNPDEIDPDYLTEIGEAVTIPRRLIQLAAYRDHPEILVDAFQSFSNKQFDVLPEHCALNSRYVFLDNIQDLNAALQSFLLSVLQESRCKGCPFHFFFVGQSYILESNFYRCLREKYAVATWECKLSQTDIINNIRNITSFDLDLSPEIIGNYFPNLIMLISFLKFISFTPKSELRDLNEFLMRYITFVNGRMGETLVLDQFSNIMSNKDTKSLCFAIYTSPNGVLIDETSRASVTLLLKSGLVRFSEQNRLVPFHDVYENIFRRAYQISKREMGLAYTDALDRSRDVILFSASYEDIAKEAVHITQLRKSGHFYSVCYILDAFFENPQATIPAELQKKPQYLELYYQLFFDYAYAAVNCSRRYTGYTYFEEIYEKIKGKTSTNMRLLQIELLYELMNSNYNVFRYKEAMQRYLQFQKTLSILIKSGQLSRRRTDNELYIACEDMRILIQSSRGKKRSEEMFLQWRQVLKATSYQHHYVDFHLRYAHTLYSVDPVRAFQYTEEAYNNIPQEGRGTSKIWFLARFQYLYLHILLSRDYTQLQELEQIVDAARKDYYSSYRHRNLALCAILYVFGDVQKADERFLKDMVHPRELRDKLKGFYFETLALYYLAHHKHCEASAALEQAGKLFQKVPSYLRTIRHNQKVIARELFSPKRMGYNLGGPLKRDWYYIDPRVD